MNITPFTYQGIALQESCWIDGVPFFTRRAIGEFLEYKHPNQAIEFIIKRNSHIDDPRWSTVIKLNTVEGDREVTRSVKTYNPIGLQLIIFESRQKKAIQYKIAVANLVWALMNGQLKPSKWSQNDDLVSAARQILSLPQGEKRAALVRDLAERDGVSLQTAYLRVQRATGKRLKTTKGRPICRKDKGSTRYPDEKEKVINYFHAHPGATGKTIHKILGITASYSRLVTWIRETKRDKH
jgi:hypothetical protein